MSELVLEALESSAVLLGVEFEQASPRSAAALVY